MQIFLLGGLVSYTDCKIHNIIIKQRRIKFWWRAVYRKADSPRRILILYLGILFKNTHKEKHKICSRAHKDRMSCFSGQFLQLCIKLN